MTVERIIARLDVKGPNVIKGIHLEGLKVVGSPRDLARRYYDEAADEIVFMDVVASLFGRNNLLDVVNEAASEIFIPMTVGGGIRTIEDIVAILRAGADKVAINTAAINRPDFLSQAAERFGRQCIVLSVEAKRRGANQWEALTDNGRETTGKDAVAWVKQAEDLGVGEILVTSVDKEGTQKGFDRQLMEAIYPAVQIPVIACGGAGSVDHIAGLLDERVSDAVCCASIFHYGICALPDLKGELRGRGYQIRT